MLGFGLLGVRLAQRCVNVPWGGKEVDPTLHSVQHPSYRSSHSRHLRIEGPDFMEDLSGIANEYYKCLTYLHIHLPKVRISVFELGIDSQSPLS